MEYQALIIDPLKNMVLQVFGYLPTLFIALGILIGGYLVARVLVEGLKALFKAISLDKLSDKVGLTHVLKNGDISHKPSEMLVSLVYWVFMIMVLIMTIKALGLAAVSGLLDKVLGYIPAVISGVFVLVLGMLIAKVVSGVIHVTASTTHMPHPETLARLSKYAIVVYVAAAFLKEIGFGALFVGSNATIFFTGIVLALAIAFGLAGKSLAAKYLDVLKKDH
jgi:hypothetical protein